MNEPACAASDITLVVRSAGERTLHACTRILNRAVRHEGGAEDQVHVVAERPFSAAVRRTIELGLAADRPFVAGIDADVLLAHGGLTGIRRICAAMKPDTFSVAGLVLCRFFGGYCFRGVHVYRREHLRPALALIGQRTPGGADPDLKPETAVVEAMKARGHGFEALPIPLGVHDFEQSYRHIYLKMRLRARRQIEIDHKEGSLDDWRRVFDAAAAQPTRSAADFIVARWGLDDGAADARRRLAGDPSVPASYDWFTPWPEFDARMTELGWNEKPPLDPGVTTDAPDRIMAAHDVLTDGRTPGWIRDRLARRAA